MLAHRCRSLIVGVPARAVPSSSSSSLSNVSEQHPVRRRSSSSPSDRRTSSFAPPRGRSRRLAMTPRRYQSGGDATTYYDSQSGMHVPIHDESKCLAYLLPRDEHNNDLEFLRAVDNARSLGMAGSLMSLPRGRQLQRDGDETATEDDEGARRSGGEGHASDEEFTIFLRLPPRPLDELLPILPNDDDVSLCFEYSGERDPVSAAVRSAASQYGTARRTSLGVFDPAQYVDADPVVVASDVASLIDDAPEGGISRILLVPGYHKALSPVGDAAAFDDDDALVRLCEELCYLDVPGPTIKSRLVVSATTTGEDALEECLGMGITKYVVTAEEDEGGGDGTGGEALSALADAAREQGKDLYLHGRAHRR